MTSTIRRSFSTLLILLFAAAFSFGQEAPAGLAAGLRDYQAGRFAAALEGFRSARTEAEGTDYAPYADFWVARTLMAIGGYADASDAFDMFLSAYAAHPYREEARYQRARLFYLTEEYEAAVQGFGTFLADFPASDFSANALYWTGESLYELGQVIESRRFFVEVIERYPTSFRVEAARYRKDIIDLKLRENELLTLMQWSHEEYLAALDEFRQKELAYQEALQSYRQRLSSLAGEDFQQEIEALNARITELEETLALRDEEINDLLSQLRQAQARADALVEISAAAAAIQSSGGQTSGGQTTAGQTQGTGSTSATSAGPPAASTAAVQNELLSLKAAALELQQRLLEEGSDE